MIVQRHTHTRVTVPHRGVWKGRAYISEMFMIEKQTGKPCSAIIMEVYEAVVKNKTSIRSQGKDAGDMRGHTLLFPVDRVMCPVPRSDSVTTGASWLWFTTAGVRAEQSESGLR